MFCACPVVDYEAPPNSSTCPICLALPGSLPVPNSTAIDFALSLAHALNCTVNTTSTFARKNYFYPDLPKGYQITQDKTPIAENGFIELSLDGVSKKIRIKRIHLEEDAGKSYHPMGLYRFHFSRFQPLWRATYRDRFRTRHAFAARSRTIRAEIRQIVTYLGICSAIWRKAICALMPMFRFAHSETRIWRTHRTKKSKFLPLSAKALDYEVERHKSLISAGEKVHVETMLWDEKENVTISMRSKETASDYRYFLEPDILSLNITQDAILNARQKTIRATTRKNRQIRTRIWHLTHAGRATMLAKRFF
jgi:aspartyl-tRNA(Asn)/glutamyl-tRNA(Gln) amidotransferase subunit B